MPSVNWRNANTPSSFLFISRIWRMTGPMNMSQVRKKLNHRKTQWTVRAASENSTPLPYDSWGGSHWDTVASVVPQGLQHQQATQWRLLPVLSVSTHQQYVGSCQLSKSGMTDTSPLGALPKARTPSSHLQFRSWRISRHCRLTPSVWDWGGNRRLSFLLGTQIQIRC